jgi:hypothetical protein
LKTRKTRRRRRPDGALMRPIVAGNVVAALRDESYTQISRWVDELQKDPEIRKKIEYHTRQILKAIAAKL